MICPYFKPTALNRHPHFCSTSAHTPTVHLTWPAAQIGRLRSLASTPKIFNEAVTTFIGRFRDHHVKPQMVDYIRSICVKRPGERRCRDEHNANMRTVWIVVGYHPLIYGPLKRCVNRANRDPDLQFLHKSVWNGMGVRIMISWSNRLRHITHQLQSIHGR